MTGSRSNHKNGGAFRGASVSIRQLVKRARLWFKSPAAHRPVVVYPLEQIGDEVFPYFPDPGAAHPGDGRMEP